MLAMNVDNANESRARGHALERPLYCSKLAALGSPFIILGKQAPYDSQASVAQLLALRVLVVILSLWVLEDLCYKISVTRVREYGRCGCPWSAKTACCDHATSVPHQVAISHFAGRLPHNRVAISHFAGRLPHKRVAISHFACRNKPFCIHFEVAISQWACRTTPFAKTGSEQTSVGAFRVHLTLCTLSRGGGRSALA